MLDPIRYLSNLSTGEMGYALAAQAKRRGCRVTLVTGPTQLKPPEGVSVISIVSAQELKKACERKWPRHQVLVMAAAVCDFTATRRKGHKIKRSGHFSIGLRRTPDIVAGFCRRKKTKTIIGFSLETRGWLKSAHAKLKQKGLDGIVANYYTRGHNPFGRRRICAALVDSKRGVQRLGKMSKMKLAAKILDWISGMDPVAGKKTLGNKKNRI